MEMFEIPILVIGGDGRVAAEAERGGQQLGSDN